MIKKIKPHNYDSIVKLVEEGEGKIGEAKGCCCWWRKEKRKREDAKGRENFKWGAKLEFHLLVGAKSKVGRGQ